MKPTPEQTHELATITLHPGWDTLRRLVDAKADEVVQAMARRIVAGDVPSGEQVQYLRGYQAGLRDAVASPTRAVARLKKLAEGERIDQTEE